MDKVALMQSIVNEEIADISLYKSESRLFAKKIINGTRISKIFDRFAVDEAEHIKALTTISDAQFEIKERIIPASSSLRKTLRVHLAREADSIRLYKTLIHLFEKTSHKEVATKILEQENRHLGSIKRYLMLIK